MVRADGPDAGHVLDDPVLPVAGDLNDGTLVPATVDHVPAGTSTATRHDATSRGPFVVPGRHER